MIESYLKNKKEKNFSFFFFGSIKFSNFKSKLKIRVVIKEIEKENNK